MQSLNLGSMKTFNKARIPCHDFGRIRAPPSRFTGNFSSKQKNERPRSCSNLIKKFLHGSAAHSATPSCPDLTSVYVSPSLSFSSEACLEKLKIIFLRKRINPGGGGRAFCAALFSQFVQRTARTWLQSRSYTVSYHFIPGTSLRITRYCV